VKTKGKYHISVGHQTGIGAITLFSCEASHQSNNLTKSSLKVKNSLIQFDFKKEYRAEELLPKSSKPNQQA
jgi:hypothetical protein